MIIPLCIRSFACRILGHKWETLSIPFHVGQMVYRRKILMCGRCGTIFVPVREVISNLDNPINTLLEIAKDGKENGKCAARLCSQ